MDDAGGWRKVWMSGGKGRTEGNGGRKEGEEVNNLTEYEAEKTARGVVELQSQGEWRRE